MANPFAAPKSGMASMFESFLPHDVLEAIKLAKEQLPAVIDEVQKAVARIEAKIDTVQASVALVDAKLTHLAVALDNTRVPDVLPSELVELGQLQAAPGRQEMRP